MIISTDSKGVGQKKSNPDPENIIVSKKITKTKTIIFIRHGESDWNNVFNKGINIGFIYRLFSGFIDELKLILSPNDSKFIDSPLNAEGITQALELREFLSKEGNGHIDDNDKKHATAAVNSKRMNEMLHALRGDDNHSSVVVSSILRRAIATTTLSLWNRISKNNEKVYLLSSLQEISRNVDTRALSMPKEIADLPFSRIYPHCMTKSGSGKFNIDDVYDASDNFGNKTTSFYGIKRLRAFNEWVFLRNEETIIVGGHSLWFKYYFQTYLPYKNTHICKKKKIANSGVVGFTLHRAEDDDGTPLYRIDPDSITTVFGGFDNK